MDADDRVSVAVEKAERSTLIRDLTRVSLVADGAFAAQGTVQNGNGQVFGGQIIAQAITAATATCDRPLHAALTFFTRPVTTERPIFYSVSIERDGGSFSSRHVSAHQETTCFDLRASFHAPEPGLHFDQGWYEEPPCPDQLPDIETALLDYSFLPRSAVEGLTRHRALDVRPVEFDRVVAAGQHKPLRFWLRTKESLGDDPECWPAVMGYLSDFMTAGAGIVHHSPYVLNRDFFGSSLNHGLWLHRPADPSEWLYLEIASHWTGGGRTLNVAKFFSADGRIAATTVQEALFRRRNQAMGLGDTGCGDENVQP